MNMANTNGYSNDAIKVELLGENIPGATFCAAFEGNTVSTIKWRLLCRGINAPSSWKKPQVSTRNAIMVFFSLLHVFAVS